MYEYRQYQIEIEGQMNGEALSLSGPYQITMTREDVESSFFSICTDQSGLIGLLRHLHGRGFVLLSITCEQGSPEKSSP